MPAIALIKSQSPAIETLKWAPSKSASSNGSKTDNRIGAISLSIAPRTAGQVLHWHRMHDETFLITKGTIRFSTGQEDYDAGVWDYVVVPPKAVHAFSNPFDEEVEFFNTFTPAYYVDYLRMLAQKAREGKGPLTVEQQVEAMKQFATFLPGGEVEA